MQLRRLRHGRTRLLKDTGQRTSRKLNAFICSMTTYEHGLVEEFHLDYEQINWLRWVFWTKCRGDEVVRRREYPSRPDEAFQAAGASPLDPLVLSRWEKEALNWEYRQGLFRLHEDLSTGDVTSEWVEDELGHTQIFEDYEEGVEYVSGTDPATGAREGDYIVCSVDRVDNGNQVAEFRARIDPDLAIDQIEGLCLHFHCVLNGVEANAYGLAFARALEDRGTIPIFERENPSRVEPGKMTKQLGWLTDEKTRNMIFTELRMMVREDRCRIRSMVTLKECRTLTIKINETSRKERIEARSGCHDDGVLAKGISMMMRNRVMPYEYEEGEGSEHNLGTPSFVAQKFLDEFEKKDSDRVAPLNPIKPIIISPEGGLVDGRRNVL